MTPERNVRVALPIEKYPPVFGGMGIQIERGLPYLRGHGIEVTILTGRLPRALGPARPDDKGRVDRVLTPGEGHLRTLWRAIQFRRYFARHRQAFDLVHTCNLGWEFLLNTRLLKALGLPLIVEMVLMGGDDPLAVSRERLGGLKLGLLRHVDVWIGLSGAFRPRLAAAGIPEDRFRLVHPGVDVGRYRPLEAGGRREARNRLGLPPEARIVISVGSVIRRKGFDRLLSAWERLRPVRGRDLLLIVGPASSADGLRGSDLDFARAIAGRAAVPELDGTVLMAGRAANVHEYLAVADLFVLLSRQEGLPIVSAEALASGLPCVVSPLEGIEAVVSEGNTGFVLHDPDDAEAVATCVSRLLDQPARRALMSEEARRLAVNRFSFERRAASLASLYRNLAARR